MTCIVEDAEVFGSFILVFECCKNFFELKLCFLRLFQLFKLDIEVIVFFEYQSEISELIS